MEPKSPFENVIADTKYVFFLNAGETPKGVYGWWFKPSEEHLHRPREDYGLRQLLENEKPVIAVGGDQWARMAIQLFNHPNTDIFVGKDFNNNNPRYTVEI